jgi:YD repeat-containing protein
MSCRKEEQPTVQICKIASSISTSSAPTTTISYEYSNDLLTKIIFSNGAYYKLEYNTNNKVSKAGLYLNFDTPIMYMEYEYVSNILINFQSYQRMQDGSYTPLISNGRLDFNTQGQLINMYHNTENKWRFEYDGNGNLVRTYKFDANTNTEYLRNEFGNFDNKKNYLYEMEAMKLIPLILTDNYYMGKNNYTSFKQYAQNGSVERNETTTFDYNESGYPIKVVRGEQVTYLQYNCQ